ncbi:hypothetical protein Pelo_15880 [Pelomyxa schiedti]|nr:hypothetical protein Pelo_15880 [Pelomyxa schiedti]
MYRPATPHSNFEPSWYRLATPNDHRNITDETPPTLCATAVLDARAQFVALASGVVIPRCGQHSALRVLEASVGVVSDLGRNWVVRATKYVAHLIDRKVEVQTSGADFWSCACWHSPELRGIHSIAGGNKLLVNLKGKLWVVDNKGKFVKSLEARGWNALNTKWVVSLHSGMLTVWKIEKGEVWSCGHLKIPDSHLPQFDMYGAQFPPGESDELALFGTDVLFVDLHKSVGQGTLVTTRRVTLPYTHLLGLLWVSPAEMLSIHGSIKGIPPWSRCDFRIFNTVTQNVTLFSQRSGQLIYPPSHLVICTFNLDTGAIDEDVFGASDLTTPCNCISGIHRVHWTSGLYDVPCPSAPQINVFLVKDLVTGKHLATVTASYKLPRAMSDSEEMLHNTRPMSPPWPFNS